MFGKVLSVCLHNLDVVVLDVVVSSFILNICLRYTTDIKVCKSKALFLCETSFTKILLLTGN